MASFSVGSFSGVKTDMYNSLHYRDLPPRFSIFHPPFYTPQFGVVIRPLHIHHFIVEKLYFVMMLSFSLISLGNHSQGTVSTIIFFLKISVATYVLHSRGLKYVTSVAS